MQSLSYQGIKIPTSSSIVHLQTGEPPSFSFYTTPFSFSFVSKRNYGCELFGGLHGLVSLVHGLGGSPLTLKGQLPHLFRRVPSHVHLPIPPRFAISFSISPPGDEGQTARRERSEREGDTGVEKERESVGEGRLPSSLRWGSSYPAAFARINTRHPYPSPGYPACLRAYQPGAILAYPPECLAIL